MNTIFRPRSLAVLAIAALALLTAACTPSGYQVETKAAIAGFRAAGAPAWLSDRDVKCAEAKNRTVAGGEEFSTFCVWKDNVAVVNVTYSNGHTVAQAGVGATIGNRSTLVACRYNGSGTSWSLTRGVPQSRACQ